MSLRSRIQVAASALLLAVALAAGGGAVAASTRVPTGHRIVVLADATPAISVITAGGTAFDSRVTYTGASLKMDVDATGKLTYGPNNLALQSNNFSSASWNKAAVSVASGVADPFGGATAFTVTATNINGNLFQGVVTINGNAINSIWVKRRTGSGAVTYYAPNDSTNINISATIADGQWHQIAQSGAVSGNARALDLVLVNNGDAVDIYNATLSAVTYETTLAQRPAADQTITTASAYYGPRFGYDQNTGVALGYGSFEQRTKLMLWSQAFDNAAYTKVASTVTADQTTAPDGTTAADLIKDDNTTAFHYFYQPTTGAMNASTVYAIGIFAKPAGYTKIIISDQASAAQVATCDLSAVTNVITGSDANLNLSNATIVAYPNGWYYCGVIASPGATKTVAFYINSATSYAGDNTKGVYAWCAGLEATTANFPGPTPCMATAGSSVTVAADVASITGSAFLGFYNQTGGVLRVTVTPPGDYNQLGAVVAATDGTAANTVSIFKSNAAVGAAGKRWVQALRASGGGLTVVAIGADAAATTAKLVEAYTATSQTFLQDNALVGSTIPDGAPALNELDIGQRGSALWCNCHIGRLDYYRGGLSTSKLIRLPLLDFPRIPPNDDQPERMAA